MLDAAGELQRSSHTQLCTDAHLTLTFINKVLRRSLEVSMQRGSRDSAGEESDEESIEEQIERDESTESLDELGLPLSSSKSSSSSRPCSSQSHLDSAELIVLDFGPSRKGLLLRLFSHPLCLIGEVLGCSFLSPQFPLNLILLYINSFQFNSVCNTWSGLCTSISQHNHIYIHEL